jgi:PKD repeat protein
MIIMFIDGWDELADFNSGNALEAIAESNVKVLYREYPTEALLHCNYSFSISSKTVDFTDESVNAEDHFWDFGDGNTSTSQNPSHTYANFGTYTVTYVCSRTTSDGYELYSEVTKDMALLNCIADFKTDLSGYTVYITDQSKPSTGYYMSSWEWDWGDGSSTETGPSPANNRKSHTYAHSDTYIITLKITDTDRCEHTYSYVLSVPSGSCYKDKKFSGKRDYADGAYRIKYKAKISNTPDWDSRIKAKVIHYKRKGNGSYWRKKANDIRVFFEGKVYPGVECTGTKEDVDQDSDYLDNKKKAKVDLPLDPPYRVGDEMDFTFYVKNKDGGTYLHNLSL